MKGKTIKRIGDIVKPHIKMIIFVTFIAVIITMCDLFRPYLIKVLLDDYLAQNIFIKGGITITMIGIAYIIALVIQTVGKYFSKYITSTLGEKVVFTIREKIYKYVEHANITFHDNTPSGKIFVAITNDTEDIVTLFTDIISTLFMDIILIFGIIVMMVTFNVSLSLLAFMILPFVIINAIYFTTKLNKTYNFAKTIRTRVNTFFAESIYGIKLIKIFNRQKEKKKECENLTKEYYKSRTKTAKFEALLPSINKILENVGISIVIWATINKWFNITIDIGVVYVFITYIQKIFQPIMRLIDNVEVLQEAIVSINKVYDIIDKDEYLEDFESGKIITDFKGKIEFKNVYFAYKDDKYVLKDISFVIEPKQSIALVGKTGCGKTTITNLINRFYKVERGDIFIDDINIKDINLTCLRKNIGIILQDPFIFATSIKDNIKLSKNVSDDAIKKTIRLSSATSFVNKLPNGIDEIASERGSSYSSGQKQLLSFARIFAHNPSIFILDEATANIDTHTEKMIQKSIDIISEEKTSIFIAHRLSTIVNVDKIIVLDKGKILEMGNHKSLLKQGGYYSELYQSYYNALDNN